MFQKSDLTRKTIELLAGTNHDISYPAIAAHCGQPGMTPRLRSAIAAARHILERDKGLVFETLRGTGLRRMDDSAIVQSTSAIRLAIRKKARSGQTRLQAVQDFAALSNKDQEQATINQTLFAMTSRLAGKDPDTDPARQIGQDQ
jgi:ribosomal protein L30/L7E